MGFKVCALENLEVADKSSPVPIDLREVTLEELLNEIISVNPGYLLAVEPGDLINLYPAGSVLDERVPALSVSGKGVRRILREDLEIERRGISLFMEFSAGEDPLIDLRLELCDLRAALNRIVGQLSNSVWHISGNPGAYSLTITEVETNSGDFDE